jgi:hypothetical protein
MSIHEVDDVAGLIRRAWSRDTSAAPDEWSADNPARGQCAVTALVLQEIFGGKLLRCVAFGHESHYFNLVGGVEVDLTRDQFGRGYWYHSDGVVERTREYVLSFPETALRYHRLRGNMIYLMGADLA